MRKHTHEQRKFSAAFWKKIGYLSGALTLIVIAFQLGQYFGNINAKTEGLKEFVSYAAKIQHGVRITSLSCDKLDVWVGDTLNLNVTINNINNFECDLWLGASIRSGDRKEYWNVFEDRTFTIAASGFTSLRRPLTILSDVPAGEYDLIVNLWHGKISDPIHSMLITSSMLAKSLTVEGAK